MSVASGTILSFRTSNCQVVFISKCSISVDELSWIEPPLKITSISIEGLYAQKNHLSGSVPMLLQFYT